MQYRLDKKSGNKLSALGLGCMRLPGGFGRIDMQKSEALIMRAIEGGVNFFDTAYLYPGSEVALGTILEKNKAREKVYIGTKLPLFKCHSYEDFDKLFNEELERLRTNYIDYYFMHNLSGLHDWKRLCELGVEKWIAEKKAEGKIKQLGFSFHGLKDQFVKLIDAYEWDFCMIQYNYININYQAGRDGLKYAHSKDIPVIIMEPLLGGRLVNDLPPTAVNLLKQSDPNATSASWALRWIWHQSEPTVLLSGMSDMAQLDENLALAVNSEPECMTDDELKIIEKVADIFQESYKIPCTGCNYCLPCPKGINIPDSFLAYNTSYTISRFAGITQYATTTGGFNTTFSLYDCTKCGHCEKHCPQNIAIVERILEVRKRMEPLWYRTAIKIAKKVMK
ncbi:MAG: aldo/keto reductase [Oscillospiraceae bacterium]|nr:aldo/keto reductase [Oscillospiraceae bacterium]